MTFRVFIYADGLVLPIVVPVRCQTHDLTDCLQRIFAHDVVATRAEVWDGPNLILAIDAGVIAALVDLAGAKSDVAPDPPTTH